MKQPVEGLWVSVWVSPSLDFHRCYLFSSLPDQPHLPTPRFSIDNISYTFSILGHMVGTSNYQLLENMFSVDAHLTVFIKPNFVTP